MEQFELGETLKLIWFHPLHFPWSRLLPALWGYQPGNSKGRARAFLWCSFILVISHGLLPLEPAAVSSQTSCELFLSPLITQNGKTKIRMEQSVSNINNMKVYHLFTF